METFLFVVGTAVLYYIILACYKYPKQQKIITKLKQKEKSMQTKQKELNARCDKLENVISSESPFSIVSDMYSDFQTIIYKEAEKYLEYKSRPAFKASEEIRILRKKTKSYIAEYKEMSYKYQFLLSVFPELKKYVDDETALLSLELNESYDDFKDTRDKAMDYLSDDEWKNLSVDDRNQLALDRYKKKTKSNWTIGMLYEMYVGYILRQKYKVIQYGIKHGLQDLGRDIIAIDSKKDIRGIFIIQCKNWSANKEIHENVICQLFGSAMEYNIKYNKNNAMVVIPVLYTTTKLSDVAEQFAARLGVIIRVLPMGDFPMIKCNINNGQKIYHLPFDQQYWRTDINKPGEFYAMTVKEATGKGFRRAMKHIVNN